MCYQTFLVPRIFTVFSFILHYAVVLKNAVSIIVESHENRKTHNPTKVTQEDMITLTLAERRGENDLG